MRNDAKANEAADKAEKDKIEKFNQADSLIFSTEKQLKEYGDKLTEGHRTAIEASLKDLRMAHAAKDTDGIDKAMESLNAAWAVASQELYKNTGGSTEPQGNPTGGQQAGNKDDVTDVDYEEVGKK
jgi:molecular chaperone DnaK